MAICYDKLWKLLIDKKMNRTELKEASGISFNVLARLGKNEPVSFESIEKICFTLNCKIEDVVEIQKDEPIQIDSDAFTTIELFAGAGGLNEQKIFIHIYTQDSCVRIGNISILKFQIYYPIITSGIVCLRFK